MFSHASAGFGKLCKRKLGVFVGVVAALSISGSVAAQPAGIYSFIVTFSPGGPADAVARAVQKPLQDVLEHTVVVENVPGAGGALGAHRLLANGPTGRTLMLATLDEAVLTPLAIASARYTSKDMRLVSVLSRSEYALVARPDFPLDIYQLLENSQTFTNGILGPASMYRLVMDDLKSRTGLKSTHVPYKGMANMVTDLIGGFVDIAFIPVAGNVPSLLVDGKLKLLATATSERLSAHPEVPTLNEVLNEKFEYSVTPGVMMHRDTPADVVDRLNRVLERIKMTDEFKVFTEQTNSTVMPVMSLADTEALFVTERDRLTALAEAADISPQ